MKNLSQSPELSKKVQKYEPVVRLSPKVFSQRQEVWDAFYNKLEIQGLSSGSGKCFRIHKPIDDEQSENEELSDNEEGSGSMDQSDIDEQSENMKPLEKYDIANNLHGKDLPPNRDLDTLITYIEKTLKSNLRGLMICRMEQKVLTLKHSKPYIYWHEEVKKEMHRLEKYISKNELKFYLTFCFEKLFADEVLNYISILKMSKLTKLLYYREKKKNSPLFIKYQQKLQTEWMKLRKTVPVECLITYTCRIIQIVSK